MKTHGWMAGRDGWWGEGLYSALYMLYVMLSNKHVHNALVLSHIEDGCDLRL